MRPNELLLKLKLADSITTLLNFFSLLQIYFDSGIQRKGNVLKPLKKVCNTKYKCE